MGLGRGQGGGERREEKALVEGGANRVDGAGRTGVEGEEAEEGRGGEGAFRGC